MIYLSDFDCETSDDCNKGKGTCTNGTCDCKPGWKLHDCFGIISTDNYNH